MKQFIKNCIVAFVFSIPVFVFSVFFTLMLGSSQLHLSEYIEVALLVVTPLVANGLLIFLSNRKSLKNSKNKTKYLFLNIIVPTIIGTFLFLLLQYLKMYGYIDGNTFF